MRLTDKSIVALALPAGKNESIFVDSDLPGFGLRLRAGGSARWVYSYRIGAQDRRVTLGSPASLTAARARSTAAELQAKVRLGIDPAGVKIENRARAAETMGATLQSYLAQRRSEVRPGHYAGIERHLVKHCRRLHGLQLAKIDRRTIAATLNTVDSKSGPIEANRVRTSLSSFYVWCIREGLVEQNPVTGTNRRSEKSRDRVLSPKELKAIWNGTAGAHDYYAIIRLLMLTGCRLSEIGALRWSEVFGDRVVLPAERTKNGRAHIVPLSDAARAILAARPRNDEYVFGRNEGRPFSGWNACKDRLDAEIAIQPWRIHDLRRTAATRMAELGVQPHVIEVVLNHVSGHKAGVAGIYNRATYEPEKRQALILWAEHLAAIVESRAAKVVSLQRA
jgi:integrase